MMDGGQRWWSVALGLALACNSSDSGSPDGSGGDAGGGGPGSGGIVVLPGAGGSGTAGAGGAAGTANGGTAGIAAPGTWSWAVRADGTGNENGYSVAVLADGSVYVAGTFEAAATFGDTVLTSAGGIDIFLAKYDGAGKVLWAKSAGGANSDYASSVAVLADGSAYITGNFTDAATFGVMSITAAGSLILTDAFVAKYDRDGNALWAKSAGGAGRDEGLSVAVLDDGTAYVTGAFNLAAKFGAVTITAASGAMGASDVFLAKYDSGGNVLWAKRGGGTGFDRGASVALLPDGTAYVAGAVDMGAAMFGDVSVGSAGAQDAFVAKYDASGNVLWAKSAGGMENDWGASVAVHTDGSAYLKGLFEGSAKVGTIALATEGFDAGFLAKYDSNGNLLWANKADGTHAEYGRSIAVRTDGAAYVTGHFLDSATFGASTLTAAGQADIFLALYDRDGNVLWAKGTGGTGPDVARALAILPDGSVYVTGQFGGKVMFGATLLTATGAEDIFVGRWR